MSSITLGYRVEHPKYGTGYVRSIRRSSESRPYVCVFRRPATVRGGDFACTRDRELSRCGALWMRPQGSAGNA